MEDDQHSDSPTQFLVRALATLGIRLSNAQATELEAFAAARNLPVEVAVVKLVNRGLATSLIMQGDD